VAEDGDEYPVRIARVDGDLWNLLSVAEAEVRPRLAGVGRLVDPVTGREVGALQPFPAADVHDVRVRRSERDRADRAGRLIVEDRDPGTSEVGGLPDTTVDDADVEDVRLIGNPGRGFGTASAMRANHSPTQCGEQLRVDLLRADVWGHDEDEYHHERSVGADASSLRSSG
jgi:hypothetical protein